MADTKISALAELTEVPDDLDEVVLVDKSDTSMAASGTDKKVKGANVFSTGQFLRQSDFTGSLKLAASTEYVVGDRIGIGSSGSVEIPGTTSISISEISDGAKQRLASRWTYCPEEYGARGDGTQDDTNPFRTMMQAIQDDGIGGDILLTAGKTYLLNGAPITTGKGNAIVPLPLKGGALGQVTNYPFPPQCLDVTIRCLGKGSATIKTTRTGDTYSGTFGTPSIIGGPTPEVVGATLSQATTGNISVKGVLFQVPTDPAISCLDLWYTQAVTIDGLSICTPETSTGSAVVGAQNVTIPTHVWTFGVRLPNGANQGTVQTRDIYIQGGPYCGIVVPGSHNNICASVQFVTLAVGISTGIGNGAETIFPLIIISDVKYGFAGWDETNGARSLSGGEVPALSGQLLLEGPAHATWNWTALLLDANNKFTGSMQFFYWALGPSNSLPTITGGGNLNFQRIWPGYMHSSKGLKVTGPGPTAADATTPWIETAGATAFQTIFENRTVETDTYPTIQILSNGITVYGTGGAAAGDVSTSRVQFNTMKVSGMYAAGLGFEGAMFHRRSGLDAGQTVALLGSEDYGVPERLSIGAGSVDIPATSSLTIYNVS